MRVFFVALAVVATLCLAVIAFELVRFDFVFLGGPSLTPRAAETEAQHRERVLREYDAGFKDFKLMLDHDPEAKTRKPSSQQAPSQPGHPSSKDSAQSPSAVAPSSGARSWTQ